MAVELEIRDGNPWWLSPDIWVVPGSDPNGPPGPPVAGGTSYLWARVRNNGESRVENARVNFYWANPAVGFDRTTANVVGSANVTLDGGQVEDVLCLTPWSVVWVNDGHECVLAEVSHPSDPLPPGPAFNVPTDRHVAQRNLGVVMAAKGMLRFAFEVHNPGREPRLFRIVAEQGKIGELEPLIPTLGKDWQWPKEGRLVDLGFVPRRDPDPETARRLAQAEAKIELPPGGRGGFTLVGRLEGGGALVHVRQLANDQDAGGLSVLVLAREE